VLPFRSSLVSSFQESFLPFPDLHEYLVLACLFLRPSWCSSPEKTQSNCWTPGFILDAAWVIGSYPLLFVVPFSTSGKWIVGIVAEVVMVVALMQWLGIRRIRKGNVLPESAR
jgi:hypothetical protein